MKRDEFYIGCSFLGHASTQDSNNVNLVCASVSILSQTLYSFLKNKNMVFKNEEMDDGYLNFIISEKRAVF